MNGLATCPFCNVVNRFGENERRCPHYRFSVTEEYRYPWKHAEDKYFAVFREEQEETKVLVEEESDE